MSGIPLYAQSGYGKYLEKTSVANTTNNSNWFSDLFKNNSSSYQSANRQNMNSSTSKMREASDLIPNYNVWTALAKSAINATAEFFDSMQQRRQLEHTSNNYQWQSVNYLRNSSIVDLDIQNAQNDIRYAQDNVYAQYRMGEIQAMEQGLSDAQQIHHERAVTAGSGVRMNSESKMEVNQANRQSSEINQWIIQQNTNSNAKNAKMNVVNLMRQMSDLEMQKANYMAQAVIANGNAQASNIEAKSIKPFENSLYTFALSMAQSMNFSGMGIGK